MKYTFDKLNITIFCSISRYFGFKKLEHPTGDLAALFLDPMLQFCAHNHQKTDGGSECF